ncbi:FG-GAP repeat domain-containing protein [Streptomyces sp. NPDC002730]|uniref:FG-GAP repeat domain-containing protein n=1 Tax=Streptomyces sp. NPDC002730 TaxID=3364662 RepID=UPI0036AE4B68
MIESRMSRPRLTAAIAVGLAVTAGPLAGPAIAAPAAGTAAPEAAAQADSALPIASGSEIVSAGSTGFLSTDAKADVRWTRYSDGSSTLLGHDFGQFTQTELHGAASDTVAMGDDSFTSASRVVTLTDMASGATPVQIDLRQFGTGYRYAGTVGSTVIATFANTPNTQEVHLVAKTGGSLSDRTVTGLPADARSIYTSAAAPGSVLLQYQTRPLDHPEWHLAIVDLATAAVTDTHAVGTKGGEDAAALSPTHAAWIDADLLGKAVLSIAKRGSTELRRFPLEGAYSPRVGLVGDWVAYADSTPLSQGDASNQLIPLTVMPIDGGPTRRLMDHVTSLTPTPDGALLAMGGTLDKGEGVYRISAGADGAPVVELIASTGEPTKVTFLGHSIPAVIDLDRNRGQVPLEWRLSRLNVEVAITLRHTRTGQTAKRYIVPNNGDSNGPQRANLTWDGLLDNNGRSLAAYNGDYTWQISAQPYNGIGPALTASGTFKVTRKAAPHDYSDNGSPDLLARDSSGRLWREDTHYDLLNKSFSGVPRKLIGTGWQNYNQIEAVGNVGGASVGDLVARDKSGTLWLYLGKSDGTFATRTKVGGGWQIYRQLAGGGDLTGDGKADLVATDTAGALWLYKGTGDAHAPFAARKKIGAGWQIYNQVTATGNIAGSSAGDLVARDASGVLWLYQGRGDGTLSTRVKIGGGWHTYTHVVGIGDGNRDGRPDLYAFGPDATSYYYESTGNASAPFRARSASPVLFDNWQSYNHLA